MFKSFLGKKEESTNKKGKKGKKNDEKKFEITNEFYFLFYAQNQLPLFDKGDSVMNTFIDNLRINDKLKIDILNFFDHNNKYRYKFNIIDNITKFNYFHENNNNKKRLKVKYIYYIIYLSNAYFSYYHYKILRKLIENELLKFNITIEFLKKKKIFKKKIMNKSYEKEYLIDYMDIDDTYPFYFSKDKIDKIDKIYFYEIFNFFLK